MKGLAVGLNKASLPQGYLRSERDLALGRGDSAKGLPL